MTHAKRVLTLFLSGALLCAAAPARTVVQEYQTLELVRTYSEEEIQDAYPDLFPKPTIQDEGDVISFYAPATMQLVKQIKKRFPQIVEEIKDGENTIVTAHSYEYSLFPTHPSLLIMAEYERKYFKETGEDSLWPQLQKSVVYNDKGEEIIQLPLEANQIVQSPNQQFFVAFNSSEGAGEYLYFYSQDGTLVNTQKLHMEVPCISYSWNGEFIAVSESNGHFCIFTKTGEVVYDGSHIDFGLQGPLNAVFVSEDGKHILVDASKHLQLCPISGQCLWKKPSSEVYDAQFLSQKELVVLKSRVFMTGKAFTITIQVVSLTNGSLLDEIFGVSEVAVANGKILIQKGGIYYEYEIR